MQNNRDTFGTAGEAVLASILALAFAFITITLMIRRSNGWLLVFPIAYGFTSWASGSWREVFSDETNVQPHSRVKGRVR